MFSELHFEHNTVCQLTTDADLLESPFGGDGDTIIITSPQGKCDNQIKKSVNYQDQVFFFLKNTPTHPEFPVKQNLAKFGLLRPLPAWNFK